MNKSNKEADPLILTVEDIKTMIPHRYPFLFIDSVKNLQAGKSASGIKNVTINEPYFSGHFPRKPIMPGVLIIEAMAQTAAVLVVQTLKQFNKDQLVYFMSIEKAKFRRLVVPGNQLCLNVSVIKQRTKIWKFEGTALVDDEVAAEAEFTAMMVEG